MYARGGLGNLFPGRMVFGKNIYRRVFIRDERFLIWISAREFLSGTNGFLSIFFFGFFELFLFLLVIFYIFSFFFLVLVIIFVGVKECGAYPSEFLRKY